MPMAAMLEARVQHNCGLTRDKFDELILTVIPSMLCSNDSTSASQSQQTRQRL